MSRDKQNEIHELAKQMSEAISTEVEQRYIEDEAKLRAVLIENGWRKASEVAEEIFAEIEFEIHQLDFDREETRAIAIEGIIANAKKKYIGRDTNVTTNTED